MRFSQAASSIALFAVLMMGTTTSAFAAEVLCQSTARNHMYVDSAYVKSCVDAGVGNIGQGSQANDDFLNQFQPDPMPNGPLGGYTSYGDQVVAYTKTDPKGTFSFAASFWDNVDQLFIGFKFGTGNTPDEWMVYELQEGVTSGEWRFVDVLANGNDLNNRLSHAALYSKGDGGGDDDGDDDDEVPEPGTLALVGLALTGLAASRRRNRKQ